MSFLVRAPSVAALLVASASFALAQPKEVSIAEFGKLSLSVSTEKDPPAAAKAVALPKFGLYKWRDELHDLDSAPASLPASFYAELRSKLTSFPSTSVRLPANDCSCNLRFPFRLRFKPQDKDPIDVSGILLHANGRFSVPKDAAYDPVRPILEQLIAQWERKATVAEGRDKSQLGFVKLEGGKVVLLDDKFQARKDSFAIETADPSLRRLLDTLDGRTVPVRVVIDEEKKTARVLGLSVHAREWDAPVTAKDGSRLATVGTTFDRSGGSLEVTGVDANGAAIIFTPVGPGTLPVNQLTLSVDPKPGSFFAYSPKVEKVELCDLVKKMAPPSATPGVLGALGRP